MGVTCKQTGYMRSCIRKIENEIQAKKTAKNQAHMNKKNKSDGDKKRCVDTKE